MSDGAEVDVSHAKNCFDVLKIISQINLDLHTQIVEGVFVGLGGNMCSWFAPGT